MPNCVTEYYDHLAKQSEINKLKTKAKRLKLKINAIYDDQGHSGGKSIVEMLCPEVKELQDKFETVMDELRVLDPSCPPKESK